jgi:uncharacterized protein YbjT (DUF2867 family)
MEIVLTGGTGFVGSEVLAQLLADSKITKVTCLTRRPLALESSKVENLLHSDFSSYDDILASTLADHDGCIWALGGKATDTPDSLEYERATFTFTIACATAIAERLRHPFHFCYLSGMGADPTESAWLPWERRTRYLKGRTERALRDIQGSRSLFHSTSFRPAGILPKSTGSPVMSLLSPIAVRVDVLAKAMVRRASAMVQEPYRVLSNAQIKHYARV